MEKQKRLAETIMIIKRCLNLDVKIARIFNTYGSNICQRAMEE